MSISISLQCLRKVMPAVAEVMRLPELSGVPSLSEGLLWATADDCKTQDQDAKMKKLGPVCKMPDMRKKPIPPYRYGYCKEPEPEMPMSCPPKIAKKGKGPCCHDTGEVRKGGCQHN